MFDFDNAAALQRQRDILAMREISKNPEVIEAEKVGIVYLKYAKLRDCSFIAINNDLSRLKEGNIGTLGKMYR